MEHPRRFTGMLVGGDGHGERIVSDGPTYRRIVRESFRGVLQSGEDTPPNMDIEEYRYCPASVGNALGEREFGFFVLDEDGRYLVSTLMAQAIDHFNEHAPTPIRTLENLIDYVYHTVRSLSIPNTLAVTRPFSEPEVVYGENMPGMTLDEFQAWSDQIIREVENPGSVI